MLFETVLLTFKDAFEKARYMANRAMDDTLDPIVRGWAAFFNQIEDRDERGLAIFYFCRDAVDYTNDPGVEVLDSSGAVLLRGFADCDAKTRLLLALCALCRVPAKIDPIIRSRRNFPHVRAWIFLRGRWWRCDPTIQNSEPGRIPRRGFITNTWGTDERSRRLRSKKAA